MGNLTKMTECHACHFEDAVEAVTLLTASEMFAEARNDGVHAIIRKTTDKTPMKRGGCQTTVCCGTVS